MVDDLFELDADGAVVVHVHAQPGAGRSAVVGRHGDALKVKVAAPPEDGRANDAIAALLADAFAVAPSAVSLRSGGTSRQKRYAIAGIDAEAAHRVLERLVAGDGGGNRPQDRTVPRPR